MELQDIFYALAIIYMSVMLLITVALLVALLVIKKKIEAIHQRIEEKLAIVNNIVHLGSNIVSGAKRAVGRR